MSEFNNKELKDIPEDAIQEMVDNVLLDGVNEGSIVLNGIKFEAKKWCGNCRGHGRQHFCKCGEPISIEQCRLHMGLCVECRWIPVTVSL